MLPKEDVSDKEVLSPEQIELSPVIVADGEGLTVTVVCVEVAHDPAEGVNV